MGWLGLAPPRRPSRPPHMRTHPVPPAVASTVTGKGAMPRDAMMPCVYGGGVDSAIRSLRHREDEDACKEAALRLLDAAARSTGGLRGKLAERGYEPQVIDAVIDRLVELRLLDDEEYARMVVRGCVGRMMGMRGTVMELTRKGVDRAVARSVVQEAAEQGVFDEAAWELGRSVAHKARACGVEVQRRRFWSAGGRKGHDPQVLREVAHALFVAGMDDE